MFASSTPPPPARINMRCHVAPPFCSPLRPQKLQLNRQVCVRHCLVRSCVCVRHCLVHVCVRVLCGVVHARPCFSPSVCILARSHLKRSLNTPTAIVLTSEHFVLRFCRFITHTRRNPVKSSKRTRVVQQRVNMWRKWLPRLFLTLAHSSP